MTMIGATFVLLCTGVVAGPEGAVLDDATFSQWRQYIAPTEPEMCWRTIPWRETFQQAVRDSQIEGKPILLWAMNGHPLGCV